MTKSEFIAKLSSALRANQSEETVNGLLNDFNEHFDEAIRAGKSEAEICDMLGDPDEIAAEYGEEVRENALPADDAGVYINLFHLNLSCEPCDGDDFYVEIRQNNRVIQDDTIQVEQTKNSLRITQLRDRDFISFLFHVFTFSETVCVRIPRRFFGDMAVKMTSGNARLNGVVIKGDLHCELKSGNVNMVQVSSSAATVCSRSGNITADSCSGDISVECHSGNAKVISHKGNVLRAATSSGTVRVSAGNIAKDCRVEAKSGGLHVDLNKLDANLTLDCYSGSIKFSVQELCGNITGKTRSGNITGWLNRDTRAVFMLQSSVIHNRFPNAVMPEPGVPVVNLATRSGLVHLKEL